MKAIKTISIQQSGRLTKDPISETLTLDNSIDLIIKGKPDAVKRMSAWLLAASKKEDYKELMKPFFKSTRPGKPLYFPLIGEEDWDIFVLK